MRKFILALVASVMVMALVWLPGCTSNDITPPIDCAQSGLQVNLASKTNPTTCTVPNGTINLTGSGGTAPYQFKLDNGPYQASETFTNLAAGAFQASIKDSNGCENSLSVLLDSPGNLVITDVQVTDTSCGGVSGSIAVTAIGQTTLTYQLNNGPTQTSSTFSNLAPGNYTIVVADANSCSTSTSRRVLSDASYTNGVRPILLASCQLSNNGCHSSSSGRDLTTYNNVRLRAGQIKNRIALPESNPSFMPRGGSSLPQSEIKLITCWVDDGAPNN